MELRDYLRVLRKGWALILAFVIIGVGAGIGLTLITKKSYQATAEIFVAATSAADTQQQQSGNQFVQGRVPSYISVANAPGVTGPVIKALHLPLTDPELAGMISASAPLNKVLIDITVTNHDPKLAATIAQAVALQFTNFVANTIEPPDPTTGKPVVKLTVTKPATVPGTPTSPKKVVNVGLGLVLGLLVGVGLAMLREILDNTVKGASDFEPFGVPVLGNVPFDKRTTKTPVAFRGDPHSSRSEAYRQIRTNLQFVDVDNPPRIIAISSAIPGEGKSTTAINLAAALAEAGARVCLVEADLRRPSIAEMLGLVADVGFTTVVIGKAPVETVLQNAGRNLAVLTSGPIPPNPSELLLSKHAKQVIYDIAAKVDFTIIDTPPLLPVTDGAELATVADGMILVHRSGKTTRDQALRAMEALDKVGKKPIGVVLNMITRQGGKYDYEYGYSYAAYRPNVDPKKSKNGSSEPPAGASFDPGSAFYAEAPSAVPNALPNALPGAIPESVPTSPAAPPLVETSTGRRGRRRRGKETAEAAAPTIASPSVPPQTHFASDAHLTSAAGAPAPVAGPSDTPPPPPPPANQGDAGSPYSYQQVTPPPLVPTYGVTGGLSDTDATTALPVTPAPEFGALGSDESGVATPQPTPLWFRSTEPQ